jgi:hypothetical protein
MRAGRRLALPVAALAAVPTLTGCALLDLVNGSTIEDAFEYVPADTFEVRFADAEAPGDLAATELGRYAELLEDAPFNEDDVEWEVAASWGDPAAPDGAGTVWKVKDEADLGALADDLEDKGYHSTSAGSMKIYSVDLSAADEDGTIGGVYPASMLNVLIAEDDQVVASAIEKEPLLDVAAVIVDDDDSLADDGRFDDLLEVADDPDVALLTEDETTVCARAGRLPDDVRSEYDDLGRPEARAIFVAGDDASVQVALRYADDAAAEDDLDAREALIEDGADLTTRRPFDQLGDFSIDRDGDLLVIDEDFDGGAQQALESFRSGGGPSACLSPRA